MNERERIIRAFIEWLMLNTSQEHFDFNDLEALAMEWSKLPGMDIGSAASVGGINGYASVNGNVELKPIPFAVAILYGRIILTRAAVHEFYTYPAFQHCGNFDCPIHNSTCLLPRA